MDYLQPPKIQLPDDNPNIEPTLSQCESDTESKVEEPPPRKFEVFTPKARANNNVKKSLKLSFNVELQQLNKMSSAINNLLDRGFPAESESDALRRQKVVNQTAKQEIQKIKVARPKFLKCGIRIRVLGKRIKVSEA